jgi:proteasome lid subunit RPN8/RPN11
VRLHLLSETLLTPAEKHAVRRVGSGKTEHAVAGDKRFSGNKDSVKINTGADNLAITAHSHPGSPIPSPKDIVSIHNMLAVALSQPREDGDIPSHSIVSGDGRYVLKFTPNKNFDPEQDLGSIVQKYDRMLDRIEFDDAIDFIVNQTGMDVKYGKV